MFIYIYAYIIIAKKFDTLQNNNRLKSKLLEIKFHSPKQKSRLFKSPFKTHLNTSGNNTIKTNKFFKTNIIRGKSFIESTIFDKNFNLTKRINEKNSVYSLSQWKKDFKKSRIYKKISCEYPSINFVAKPKRKFTQNYAFSPKVDYNIFNGIKFKPFTSFENENNKESNSFNKSHKKKKKHFVFTAIKDINKKNDEKNKNKEKKDNINDKK